MNEHRLQIGVMGACHDLEHSAEIKKLAFEVGERIAKAGHILLFGANKDEETLPTDAARGAKKAGGLVIGVTYGTGKNILRRHDTDVVIASGVWKGGGREFVLVNSCDVIIILSGGAGTLIETAIAYEANIPIVALKGTGGWAEKLANQYLDERETERVQLALTPEEAVRIAIESAHSSN